ncbi:hypothetical protein ACFQE8_13945 [Salinirubellus sp. GCM10025818]|uniref:DUF7282 domain-containing protein n=1 Tax=Salinirubellus TaxID=2162630 RepID=UPI0030D3AF47
MRRSTTSASEVGLLALVALAVALPLAGVATGHGINHLGADPQASADGVVRMESVFATEDGFVVVYADDGDGERVVAHRPFSASTRDVHDVPVEIPPDAWADLPRNATLRVALHGDDGDGEFEPGIDPPLTSFGGVAGDSLVVRRGTTAYVGASSGAGIQRSADGTAEVRSVRLPERGYVVLRNSSGGVPADVVGVAPLDAGDHTNVTVDLNGSFFADRPANATFSVWALAYLDDGDGRFDDDDRTVRAGEETVGTRFGVEKVLPGRTPTPTPDQGSLVVTATPTPSATATVTPTSTPASTATSSSAPSNTRSPTDDPSSPSVTGGDGSGFGPVVGLAALALTALVLGRRA